MSESSHASFSFAGIVALIAIVFSCAVHADTFTVGQDSDCDFGSIANALTAAENSFGPDTIRVTRSRTYTQQAITLTTSQELTITGGFADCGTTTEDGIYTILSGTGGAAATVLTINGGTGSLIRLRKLDITGGDVSSSSIAGGGIYYTGNGLLDIADSSIRNNTGAYGGGINAGGSGDQAELDIGANTTISDNTAYYNGGGLFSNNIETVIRGDNTLVYLNTATGVGASGGYGGGIHIRACANDSIVYLGSPGVGGLGVVYGNSARYGGGVAIEGGSSCSSAAVGQLRMFSTNATRLTKIHGNSADVSGGGIYLHPSQVPTNVYMWNASIEENSAPDASAAYLGSAETNSLLYINHLQDIGIPGPPDGAVGCAIGVPCGRISTNGDAGGGHVIYGGGGNEFYAQLIEFSGNQGSELTRLETQTISNSMFKANTTSARLIESHQMALQAVTIAGNTIGGTEVLGINTGGHSDIQSSIIWQPGKVSLHNDGNTPYSYDILSKDILSLQGTSGRLINAEPRFADPLHGDYSLTAASPAVDFAPAHIGQDVDMLSLPHDVDLAVVENISGTRDLGALERQSLAPLALNGDFNSNVNVWAEQTVGASSWDSTQNISGPAGSGSLHVNLATGADSVVARSQCIHLPGPGTYALNGWGKSTGTITAGNYVRLVWEYRDDGGETCTGTPTSSGTLLLANNGTWRRPATPVLITSDFHWTTNSSILVSLVVDEGPGVGRPAAPSGTGSLVGWFDGITLDLAPSDRIFTNGFEP